MKQPLIFVGAFIFLTLFVTSFVVLNSRTNKSQTDTITQNLSDSGLPTLEIFNGEVELKQSGSDTFTKGSHGQKVEVGSTIKTMPDSRAQLLYPNNSVVRLDQNSEIVLEDFDDNPAISKVQITKGRIWSRVAKLLGKDDIFESKTETLVASVRGTSYGHGILTDGSNKITVNKSKVLVDCIRENIPNIEVLPDKKVTTFCDKSLDVINWGGDEANDEWFGWNIQEDKVLDSRFGGSTYDDQPILSPSPSPKPMIKPTASPTLAPKTPAPTAQPQTQTNSPTATPTPTSSPTSTPAPSHTVSRASCGNYCTQKNAQVTVYGSGFDTNSQASNLKVFAVNTQGQKLYADSAFAETTGLIYATFTTINFGNYYVGVEQYGQSVQNTQATFTIND